ncbi:MAG: thioesterase domain-containing protein [Actinomycetes bacterium]
MSGGLDTRGGAGSVAADLDDLRRTADATDRTGDVLRQLGAAAGRSATDGDLLATLPLSPTTGARAQSALAGAAARLLAASLRVEAGARGLRAVAAAFAARDAAVAVRGRVVDRARGRAVLGVGLAGTALGGAALFVGAGVREVAGAARDLLPGGDGPDAARRRLRDALGTAAADTREGLAAAWTEALLRWPAVTDASVVGLGDLAGEVVGRPLSHEETVTLLVHLGGLVGWFDDGTGLRATHVTPTEDERRASPLPRDLTQVLDGIASVGTLASADSEGSRVRVLRVPGVDGRDAFVVQVPGTQAWGLSGGVDPADLTANLWLSGPEDAHLLDGIEAALRAADAGPTDPVMVAGHSQGGIAAAAFAAQAEARGLRVTHVVTFGSPIAHVDVPPHVHVLAVEHHTDPVPRLDGAENPATARWLTVTADPHTATPLASPRDAHHLGEHRATASRIDASTHPSVVAWRESAAPFLRGGGRVPAAAEALDTILRREPSR